MEKNIVHVVPTADYMPFGVAETFQNSFVFPNL
jgi:hypothetical protein